MLILALDLSTARTGFALGDLSGIRVSGSRGFPATGNDLYTLAVAYRTWLTTGLKRHKPDKIVYEMPMMLDNNAQITKRKLGGMAWQTELTAGDLGYVGDDKIGEVNVSDWTGHFLGKGNVPQKSARRKLAVQNMCRIRGFHFDDEDEADAIAILDYALACESPASAIRATPLFANQGPAPQVKLSVAEIRAQQAGLRRPT